MTTDQIRTDALTDDEPTQVYRAPEITDSTIEALRELAVEEGDVRVAELASEALAPRMQPTAEAARRHRRQTRERCAQEWSIRAARSGLLLALVALAACGVVEPDALATGVVVHVEEVAPSAPPPAPPRLAIEVGGRRLAAVEVAYYRALRVRVLAVAADDGTTTDVTAQAALETSDPLAVRVAGPGRLEAPPGRGSATVAAALAGHEPAALAVTVAPRHCLPVVDAVGPAAVRVANPCTVPYAVDGWRVAHRGPAADAPEATLATLAGELAPGEVRAVAAGPGGDPSGAVGLRAVFAHGTSLVDAVAWGTVEARHPLAEGAPAPTMTAAGLSRRDSWDADDNAADFAIGGEL